MAKVKENKVLTIDGTKPELDAKGKTALSVDYDKYNITTSTTDGKTLIFTNTTDSSTITVNNASKIKYIKTSAQTLTEFDDIIGLGVINYTGTFTPKKGKITGTKYNDTIDGTNEKDKVNAGLGNDILNGSLGADELTGGKGTNIYKYTDFTQLQGDKIALTKDENAIIDLSALNTTASYKTVGKNLEVTAGTYTFTIANFASKDTTGTKGSVILKDKTGEVDLKTGILVTSEKGTWNSDKIDKHTHTSTKNKGLTITGGKGNDVIIGTDFADTIKGGDDNDILTGGAGNDKLYGGAGDDIIYGGLGNDLFYGEGGKNTFVFAKGNGVDTIYSGKGEDTLDLSAMSVADVTWVHGKNKQKNDLIISYTEGDSIVVKNYFAAKKETENIKNTVKNIIFAEGPMTVAEFLKAQHGSGTFAGTDGDDTLIGSAEADTIDGQAGNDVIMGMAGNDTLKGDADNDELYGGAGADTIYAGAGNDNLYGDDGDDTLYGESGTNTLVGGKGADSLYGGTGADTFKFASGDGADTVHSSTSADKVEFTGTVDSLSYSKNANDNDFTVTRTTGSVTDSVKLKDYFAGTDRLNTFVSNGENVDLNSITVNITGEGTIVGTDWKDNITGSDNADTINAGAGDDTIYTGAGADTINSGTGNNTIYVGAGLKTLEKGGGTENLVFTNIDDVHKLKAERYSNDIVIYKKGEYGTEKLTKKDYTDEAIKTVKTADGKVYNFIMKDGDVVGTDAADIITATWKAGLDDVAEVHAGAGDDVIWHTNYCHQNKIWLGTGDDTVEVDKITPLLELYFENGDGNNVIDGLKDSPDTYASMAKIVLNSEDLVRSYDLGETMGTYEYVVGTTLANDRTLKLSDGETTLKIANYGLINNAIKDKITVNGTDTMLSSLYHEENMVRTLDPDEYEYDGDDRLIMAPVASASRTLDFDGNHNIFLVSGSGNQTVNVIGDENTLYVYNTGDATNNQNINTITTGGGDGAYVYVSGGHHTVATVDSGDASHLTIYDGNGHNVTTGNNNNYIDINSTGNNINYIHANGFSDNITLRDGRYYVYFGNDTTANKNITMSKNTLTTEVFDAAKANSTTILHNLDDSWSDSFDHVMFQHHMGWQTEEEQLEILFMDKDNNILNTTKNHLYINGNWEGGVFTDLDAALNKITVKGKSGSAYEGTTLNQMTQYVDMSDTGFYYGTGDYRINFADSADSGLLANRHDTYIKGTDTNDSYNNYSFTTSSTVHGDGVIIINDRDGSEDKLILNSAYNSYRFFMDFDKEGNLASDDLLVFSINADDDYNGLLQFTNAEAVSDYITVENEFDKSSTTSVYGLGRIEQFKDNGTGYYTFNFDQMIANMSVAAASWLSSYNTLSAIDGYAPCNTISEALQQGYGVISTPNNLNSQLYDLYNDGFANGDYPAA